MEVVEHVGLMTCERIFCRPKCLTPHSRKRTGYFFPNQPHMEDEDEDQENEKEDERDGEECKVESRREVRTNTAHETWMT